MHPPPDRLAPNQEQQLADLARMLIDLGDFDRSLAIHATGQSGHTNHPHYDDMIPMWAAGAYAPMPWSREQVDQSAETVQVLVPAG